MKKLTMLLAALCLLSVLVIPAGALEYDIAAPSGPEFSRPTSIEPVATADQGEAPNVDVSKNAALIPPAFGSPSAYALDTGMPLTPNLAPGYMAGEGAVLSGTAVIVVPPVQSAGSSNGTMASTSSSYTAVSSDLYYSNGSLGTLSIPRLGVNVAIFEGTDSATLAKGIGHFVGTSIWAGNVCAAAHNRGVNAYFGQIHTLNAGDTITLTTKLGTRTYAVTSVEKVLETDLSGLSATAANQITLYTCVRDQPVYRWCVRAQMI